MKRARALLCVGVSCAMQERVTVDERRALGTALPQRRLGTCVRGSAVLLDATYGRFFKSMHPVSNGIIGRKR